MRQPTPFDEMDRLFESMRRSMLGGRMAGDANVRLEATDEGYLVHADLPGFEAEELDIRFDDGLLTIDAVHEVDDADRTHSRRVHETVRLPGVVIVEDIEADYRNGVLEVRVPTAEESGGHRIEVN